MSLRQKFEPLQETFRHYRDVWRLYWGQRKAMDGEIFRLDEAEFLPPALSLEKTPVSPAARLVSAVLVLMILLACVWAVLGHVDIVVNAAGKVIPDERTKTIASVYTASVQALYVAEGQTVTAGEVLVDLDAGAFDADRDKAMGDADTDLLQAARARALIAAVDSLTPPAMPRLPGLPDTRWQVEQAHLDGQYAEFKAELDRIGGNIRRYTQALRLADRAASDYRELARTHDVSMLDYDAKEQERVEAERQLGDAKDERSALIAQTKRVAYDSLGDVVKEAAESREDAARAESQSRLLELKAPVDGTVQQLMVHTVGGVVPAAQPLMEIVPKDAAVEVEAFIANRDVGFVHEGQVAQVKVDAFDYTKYGTVPAVVRHVSQDAIQDDKKGPIYSITVALARSTIFVDGHERGLEPGMTVSVAIRTGKRRLMDYVLSPLIRHERESLNER